MDVSEMTRQLSRLAVENRPEACLGCGHEHRCSLRGCSVIREAISRIPEWCSMEYEVPVNEGIKLVACRDKKGQYTINRAWYDGEFWHGNGSMANVTHWMELPEPPEEENIPGGKEKNNALD